MALGLPCCQSSRIGQGGRYFEMMRAVCPVSVNAMISLPQCTHCVPAPRGWDQPTKAARIEDSHDSHLLSYSYLTFMKIQLVPRGNVIPIGDVPGRLIVLRSRSPKNYATVQSDRLRFIAFHTQDIRPSWAIMGHHGHHDISWPSTFWLRCNQNLWPSSRRRNTQTRPHHHGIVGEVGYQWLS